MEFFWFILGFVAGSVVVACVHWELLWWCKRVKREIREDLEKDKAVNR